jgi:4-amino-4-deoxy-L-arabinose transferase-like glycosyltransferase
MLGHSPDHDNCGRCRAAPASGGYTGEVRWWPAAAVAAYFLFFFRLTGAGLLGPDEPRYAAVGREMAASGDWVTPRLWGEPWFEKPSLLYWMSAAGFRLGLGEEAAPRFPVACLGLLFLGFFYWRMSAEFGAREARYALAVLATSAGWVAYSHAAVFDLPLAAAFGAAMFALLAWLQRNDVRWLGAFGALLGLSVLAKGLVGPVLAALVVLAWLARYGSGVVRSLARPLPVAMFLAVAGPWYALCSARNGAAFVEDFFWRHHVARFGGALAHNQPAWFFLPVLAVGLLPWTPLYARVATAGLWREPRGYFFASWAVLTVLFFSLSRDKLPGYVLPAVPAFAALAGVTLAKARSLKVVLPLSVLTLALMPAAAAVLPEALESGLRGAIGLARFPLPALAAVALAVVLVWYAEQAGRRGLAVAALTLAAVAGYAGMKQEVFQAVDRSASARSLWRQAQAHGGEVCLGELPRQLAYGLQYYAGRAIPLCSGEPRAYRIEREGVVPALSGGIF